MKFIVFFLLVPIVCLADSPVEFDYELDLYYSNVSAFIDLDRDKNITDGTDMSEKQIYSQLLKNSLSPNIFLTELSFHPMSWGGVWYRKHYPERYTKASIDNFNIIKALTAGWEEPYSISFFVGRMLVFKQKHAHHIGKNRAYMGLLVTLGNKTIKDNKAYEDNWINVEYKLKGTRELERKDLDWSFRIGYRYHNSDDFANNLYIGARRSSIDFYKSIWSLIYNSAFDTLLEVDDKRFSLTKAQIILEKKWPLTAWGKNVTFGLGIGYLYYGKYRYSQALQKEGYDEHQLIFRPNLKW